MAFGVIIFVLGYSIFYWGERHFGHQCRYSLPCLLGFGSILKNIQLFELQPFQLGQTAVKPSLPTAMPGANPAGTPPKNPQFVQGGQ